MQSHIVELKRLKVPVAFLGIDGQDRPVIARKDQNGVKAYAIMLNGAGADPIALNEELGLRQDLTTDELDALSEAASRMLFSLPTEL